jgi:Domain of unknown function (DUF4157)
MKKLLRRLTLTTLCTMALILPTAQSIDSTQEIIRQEATNQLANAAPTIQQLLQNTNNTQVWSSSGSVMMSLAAQVTANRNLAGQALSATQKKYLRPNFGDLVDRVQINYDAKLLDRWSNGEKEVHVGAVDASAQAFCDRIYLRASHRPNDTAQLVLIAHELTHFQQCQQLGGLTKFGASYFAAYQKAQQSYANNPFEKAARTREQQFIKNLCQQINCQQPPGKYYVNYQGVDTKLPIHLRPDD